MTFQPNFIAHCVRPISSKSFTTFSVYHAVVYRRSGRVWRSLRLVRNANSDIDLGKPLVSVIHIFSCHLFFLFCFPPYLASLVAMYSCSGPNACRFKFGDPPSFVASRYVCEHVNYLDSTHFSAMCESGVTLTIPDRNIIT